MGLLKRFDYLSTISGGGYIGGWLSLFIKRCAGGSVAEAEKVAGTYRARVLAAVRAVQKIDGSGTIYGVTDAGVASGVADCLANDVKRSAPLAVIAQNGDCWQISARCPTGIDVDLEALLRGLAAETGGSGGGHRSRAGARIPSDRIGEFKEGFLRGVAA